MNRRTFIKRIVSSTLAFFGLSGATYFYAREIEPDLLSIHKEQIVSSKIPEAFDGFTIAQFSDTHIGFHYSTEQLKELILTINKYNPDIIVFTGDLVDAPNEYKWNQKLIDILSTAKATHGKYWVYGNHDHGGYGTDIVKNTMEESGFVLLQNSHAIIKKNSSSINLSGLDDVMLGSPNIEATSNSMNSDLFTILLVHEPDFADVTKDYPIDLQISGHSHGGQIQIPFLGYIYTPALAQKYVEGKYELGPTPQLLLYVNRGIGTTRAPYRFLCRPELTFFELQSENT